MLARHSTQSLCTPTVAPRPHQGLLNLDQSQISHSKAPVCHRNVPVCHRNIPVCHRKAPVCHRNVPVCHRNIPVCHRNVPVCHRNVPVSHRKAPVCHRNVPAGPYEYAHTTCKYTEDLIVALITLRTTASGKPMPVSCSMACKHMHAHTPLAPRGLPALLCMSQLAGVWQHLAGTHRQKQLAGTHRQKHLAGTKTSCRHTQGQRPSHDAARSC